MFFPDSDLPIAEVTARDGSLETFRLTHKFSGTCSKHVWVKEDVLMFRTGQKPDYQLVEYSLAAIAKKKPVGVLIASNFTDFKISTGSELMLLVRDGKIRRGSQVVRFASETSQAKWLTIIELLDDCWLVSGWDCEEKTNYFVLLDTNLVVCDNQTILIDNKEEKSYSSRGSCQTREFST